MLKDLNRVKLSIVMAILSTAVLIMGACGAPSPTLDDTRWALNSYGEHGNLKALVEGTEITATFNSGKGEVSGSAGCNTYFAKYRVKGSELSITELAWTEMACISPTGVMEQEQEFLSLLGDAQSFESDDTTLTIFCSSGNQLNFTKASP